MFVTVVNNQVVVQRSDRLISNASPALQFDRMGQFPLPPTYLLLLKPRNIRKSETYNRVEVAWFGFSLHN